MDADRELADFLRSRRSRLTPEQVGLPSYGPRRVEGLRREEAAMLSGVSADYFRRLERGLATGVSDSVLASVARALKLDDAEREHLIHLARAAAHPADTDRPDLGPRVRPSVLRMLNAISTPAFLLSNRSDFLAANALGRALYPPIFGGGNQPPNFARFCFLDPVARDFYVDWDANCRDVVAHLRSEAGRAPEDDPLTALIGELATRSTHFAELWSRHDVRFHQSGTKVIRHPLVGLIELSYDVLDLRADDGLSVSVYSTEPGSSSERSLALLASGANGSEPSPHSTVAPPGAPAT